jgi:hypothetical protein
MSANTDTGRLNIKFGWLWLLMGIFEAAIIGMFVFNSDWLGGYTSLIRRFIRLSHIAFMALSIVNILYGFCLPLTTLSGTLRKIGSYCMILAAITMPIICILSAFYLNFKSLFVLPVIFFLTAVVIIVIGLFRKQDKI